MPTERIGQLAEVILDEAQQLRRMTNNTLQLARLDSNTMDIPLNWESVEEIVGTVGARASHASTAQDRGPLGRKPSTATLRRGADQSTTR